MNNIDKQYTDLLKNILDNGYEKDTRNGKVLSVFGRTIRHSMKDGKFPLLTTKKMYFKGIVTELLWFLKGDTNIKYLVDNECHIWDGDAYKNYCNAYPNVEKTFKYEGSDIEVRKMTKEEFINMIKTDDEFAKKWGELGPIYGKQWRRWGGKNTTLVDIGSVSKKNIDKVIEAAKNKEDVSRYGAHIKQQNNSIDQIANLISELKTNPDSRRMMVSAWNVADIENGSIILPPCHYGFQVYTRELSIDERNDLLNKETNRNHKRENCFSDEEFERETLQDCKAFNIPTRTISLMWNQRSVDTPLGLPYNISSYALLLSIIAKQVNMIPEEVIGNLGDCHIYTNQIEGVKEQLTREPYELPKLVHMKTDDFYKSLSDNPSLYGHLDSKDFQIEGYQSHPTIKIPLSN